jgi:myo-inositol-hexaphosphate 3-phosphohydrolase
MFNAIVKASVWATDGNFLSHHYILGVPHRQKAETMYHFFKNQKPGHLIIFRLRAGGGGGVRKKKVNPRAKPKAI